MRAKDPSFPMVEVNHDGTPYCQWAGLTKREEFAKAAMQGILANPNRIGRSSEACEAAVFYADALIAALNKEPQS